MRERDIEGVTENKTDEEKEWDYGGKTKKKSPGQIITLGNP